MTTPQLYPSRTYPSRWGPHSSWPQGGAPPVFSHSSQVIWSPLVLSFNHPPCASPPLGPTTISQSDTPAVVQITSGWVLVSRTCALPTGLLMLAPLPSKVRWNAQPDALAG